MVGPCVNCRRDIEGRADYFGGVMVCPSCYTIAVRLEEKLEKELHDLLVLAREAIRVALVEGRLSFQPPNPDAPAGTTKAEILKAIVSLGGHDG